MRRGGRGRPFGYTSPRLRFSSPRISAVDDLPMRFAPALINIVELLEVNTCYLAPASVGVWRFRRDANQGHTVA